ncbi:MAG: cupin domain-containing protein, partial [Terriglobia bacterium]
MLSFAHWSEIERQEVSPLIDRRVIAGDDLMIVRHDFKQGAVIPVHQHVHEQISVVKTGRLRIWTVDGEKDLGPDGVACIPSGVPHKAEA